MTILITGVSTRAIAESAMKSSLKPRIITVDYFGDYDQKLLCQNYSLKRDFGEPYSVGRLFEACRGLQFDALVYTSNLENHPRIVERLSKGKRLLGNTPATLSRVRDPSEFFGCLARLGIAFPKTARDSGWPSIEGQGRFLRKPTRSGGGHGIAFHSPTRRVGKASILQEYIQGLPCGAAFVANGRDAVLLGISEQLIGDPTFGGSGFRYTGSLLGPVGGEGGFRAIVGTLERILRAVTREFRLVGVNGLDFIVKDGEVYPLELNPRYTASMELVERGYGLNIFELHLQACGGKLPVSDIRRVPRDAFFGKAILFAERDLVLKRTQHWWERGIRDIPFEHEQILRGRPICTLFAQGRSRDACYRGLVRVARELREELS